LHISIPGKSESIEVVVSDRSLEKIVPEKRTGNWWNDLLAGGNPNLSQASALRAISVEYPSREILFLFWRWNWLLVFFVEVLATGCILKYFLKVEI
jgi:hypothetical protein